MGLTDKVPSVQPRSIQLQRVVCRLQWSIVWVSCTTALKKPRVDSLATRSSITSAKLRSLRCKMAGGGTSGDLCAGGHAC